MHADNHLLSCVPLLMSRIQHVWQWRRTEDAFDADVLCPRVQVYILRSAD